MSYRKMEASLVEKVKQLRLYEDALLRSYAEMQSDPSGTTGIALAKNFDVIERQLRDIEQLMDAMERVASEETLSFVPALSGALTTPAYQV
jgi:hypothetical protein